VIRRLALLSLVLCAPACHSNPAGTGDAGIADARPDTGLAVVDSGASVDGAPSDGSTSPDVPGTDAPSSDATPSDTGLPYDAGPFDAATFCALPGGDVAGLTPPPGFCVRRFASVPAARVLQFSPTGDLFVSSPSEATPGGANPGMGAILVLPDDNKDGVADRVAVFGQTAAMASVHGILFVQGQLLFTASQAVYSVPYQSGDRVMSTATPTVVADLSDMGFADRWTHTLAQGTDGALYVSRGQYDNSECPPTQPRSGSVLRIGPGHAAHGDIVATGFRNPMYMRCMPWGACYAAELSGDSWDGIGGHEKLVELTDGDDYGYPCCVDHDLPNPFIMPTPDCASTKAALQTFPLHDTPFGFDWERGGLWPAPYAHAFFVAQHGSFADWGGASVSWAPADPTTHAPTGQAQTLIAGFGHPGTGGARVSGRPADVLFAPDGRLFIADDEGATIYWMAPVSLPRP
jgi:glucose/arabinose dehydrogenase